MNDTDTTLIRVCTRILNRKDMNTETKQNAARLIQVINFKQMFAYKHAQQTEKQYRAWMEA